MNLRIRISNLRRTRRESLQQVADAVGISKAHIWDLETGRAENPSMAIVIGLADHFGVSVSYLVGEDVDAPDSDDALAGVFRQAKRLLPEHKALLADIVRAMLKRQERPDGS